MFRDNLGPEGKEEDATQIYKKCYELEELFGDLFTGKKFIFNIDE